MPKILTHDRMTQLFLPRPAADLYKRYKKAKTYKIRPETLASLRPCQSFTGRSSVPHESTLPGSIRIIGRSESAWEAYWSYVARSADTAPAWEGYPV